MGGDDGGDGGGEGDVSALRAFRVAPARHMHLYAGQCLTHYEVLYDTASKNCSSWTIYTKQPTIMPGPVQLSSQQCREWTQAVSSIGGAECVSP